MAFGKKSFESHLRKCNCVWLFLLQIGFGNFFFKSILCRLPRKAMVAGEPDLALVAVARPRATRPEVT